MRFLDFPECFGHKVVNRGVPRDILKTPHKKPDEVLLCNHSIWRTIDDHRPDHCGFHIMPLLGPHYSKKKKGDKIEDP